MKRIFLLAVVFGLLTHATSPAADEHVASFNDSSVLADMQIEGIATIDTTKDRGGGKGGALRVAPNAKAV